MATFNEKTGWYVNWSKMPDDVEIYALVIKDTMDIQGLIGIRNDIEANAAYIHWVCTAPHNNIWKYGRQEYIGVGGHLLTIVSQKSVEWNHEGVFHADLYLREFSPYESRESIGIDLLALTRYAKKNNKKTSELIEEEIDLFKIDK